MKRILGIAAIVFAGLATAPALAQSADSAQPEMKSLTLFDDVKDARNHCPSDTVIRIDLPKGFYLHGDHGFGGESLGRVYVCRDAAIHAVSDEKETKANPPASNGN